MPRVFRLALVAVVWLGGCTSSPTFDQFPIGVDLDGGVPIVRGCAKELGVSCRDGGACCAPVRASAWGARAGGGAEGAWVRAPGMPITVITRTAYLRARAAEKMPIVDSDIDTMCAKSSVFLPANPTASDVWLCPLTR